MHYLAVDIGTTTIKGVVYDNTGKVLKTSRQVSENISPRSGLVTKEPERVLKSVIEIIKELISFSTSCNTKIDFITFSCFMHSIMAVDKNGEAISSCAMWSDSKGESFATEYRQNGLGLKIYKNTGTPIHPMSPLYKLLWMKNYKKDTFNAAFKFISMKEYLFYFILGEYVIDHSIASATGIFDIHTLTWNNDALNVLELDKSRFSTPVPTTTIFHNCTQAFKKAVGIKSNVDIVIGASDGCLANLGSHGLSDNVGVVTIGTSGAVRIVTKTPLIDDQARIFSYILAEDFRVSGGAINNGGMAYDWIQKITAESVNVDKRTISQEKINNILFLPFLTGERAPYWNPLLRGAYMGLDHTHTTEDVIIATLEGICYAIKDIFIILDELSPVRIETLYANGGFITSSLWLKILASILGKPLEAMHGQGDAACFGAYLLGLKAKGLIGTWEESQKYFTASTRYDVVNTAQYQKKFELYKEAVSLNMGLFEKLAVFE